MDKKHLGQLKKMRLVSNNICFGPCPEPEDEIEQHLTINSEGRVWFSSYAYGDGTGGYKKIESRTAKVDLCIAEDILRSLSEFFSEDDIGSFVTDVGTWDLELTDTDGKIHHFDGSLCSSLLHKGEDLSDLIRGALGMDNLYVFDGNNAPDEIVRVRLDYHRVTKIKSNTVPEGAAWDHAIWDYTESLLVDGVSDTIEFIRNIGSGCHVTWKYEVQDGVRSLLEDLEADEFFQHIEGNPPDVIENPDETKDYQITIDYKKGPQRVTTGTFDKKGLPDDYLDFAETIFDFIRFYGFGEILDPDVYGKSKRSSTDYIFCSCEFEDGYKSYYYISDDDSIEEGDLVVVPAGRDNRDAVVQVTKIEYFSKDNTPMPVERVKHIIRKYIDDDDASKIDK